MKLSSQAESELLLIEIQSTVALGDCTALEEELPALISPESTTVIDFSKSQIAQEAWPRLERILCRLVARAPHDLWLIGLQGRAEWNHATGLDEVRSLLQSPPLAWARISRWIEARLQGIQQQSSRLQSVSAPDPRAALRKISLLRRRRQSLEREIEATTQARKARKEASSGSPAGPGSSPTLERLEQTILTALASQGVRLPEGQA